MPEYLAPGVYVEETSFRAKSIEGVSTSTAGFVGLTRRGPVANPQAGQPVELITSFGDFERIYGGFENLQVAGTSGSVTLINHLAHAVQAFFNEGGARLYISRVYAPLTSGNTSGKQSITIDDGNGNSIAIGARFPGRAYAGTVSFREVTSPASSTARDRAPVGTFLRLSQPGANPTDPPTLSYFVKATAGWQDSSGGSLTVNANDKTDFVTINFVADDASSNPVSLSYEGLGFASSHPQYLGKVLTDTPSQRSDALQNLYAVTIADTITAFQLRDILFGSLAAGTDTRIVSLAASTATAGNDGSEPTSTAFESALQELASVEDISIVAAPGYGALSGGKGIERSLISHAETRRSYRIAILETPDNLTPSGAREYKSDIDSTYGALYYPWVTIVNPLFRPGDASEPAEIKLPPTGFMAGIYARNDVERGVFKAPANEVVRGALRFARDINFAEQESLNPFGVNCLRFFPGRGYRVWGARTTSSDPEWKYVNIRRYFNYLEQ
ncbi:MAG: phage tail sheath subtilisin-like domain-containing protein, partial [Cyanobacteria bacterium P01_C01_bin.121]